MNHANLGCLRRPRQIAKVYYRFALGIRHLALFTVCFGSATPALAESAWRTRLMPFFEEHCIACHSGNEPAGELDLESDPDDLAITETRQRWERIYDRVLTGEMPPKDEPRPDARQQDAFLAALKDSLVAADQRARAKHGRVQGRRMTRREYEHTIHDLIGVDMPLDEMLPDDPPSHGFDTVAVGQQLSQHHLIRYIQAADVILAEAFERTLGNESRYSRAGPRTDPPAAGFSRQPCRSRRQAHDRLIFRRLYYSQENRGWTVDFPGRGRCRSRCLRYGRDYRSSAGEGCRSAEGRQ